MHIDLSQFQQTFFEESFEGLQLMESLLLRISPADPDPEEVNALFRAAHSIKGGSGTFGFNEVTSLTHLLETLLDDVREGRGLDAETINLLLGAVDCLEGMLTALRDREPLDDVRVNQVQASIARCLNGGQQSEGEYAAHDRVEPRSAPSPEADAARSIRDYWQIDFRPHAHLLQTGNDPQQILREIATFGDCEVTTDATALPPLAELDPEQSYLAFSVRLFSDAPEQAIREVFAWVEDDCRIQVSKVEVGAENLCAEPTGATPVESAAFSVETGGSHFSSQREASAPGELADERRGGQDRRQDERRQAERRGVTDKPADSNSIRVSTDKVDSLVNIVGELVITHAMLSQLVDQFTPESLDALRDGLSQLERNTREIQESVMRIRMLPISFVFARLPRLVHDLSEQLGKRVDLDVRGGQTELDKTVLEKIGDPLTHLIRNCLDHGIEPPEARLAQGKSETGTVRVHAYHQGGSIIIEVGDDGKGIDRQALVAKAAEHGLIEETESVPDDRALELIFHPGLSTAATVSNVSGRGVGMDVVRRNVLELGGQIDLRSVQGEGTTFVIRLPLTLAILEGQLVRVGTETYVLPLVAMIESSQLDPNSLCKVPGRSDLVRFRESYLPIVRLHDVFSTMADDGPQARPMLAVVEGGGERVGLVVDELLGQHQVVIKSLESNFRRVQGIAGATILGDGRVALIVDVAGIVAMAGGRSVR